jgi:hypothetical protein
MGGFWQIGPATASRDAQAARKPVVVTTAIPENRA